MNNNIFAEKYRPKSLDGIKGQDHIIKYLKKFVENKDIPHMLFAGTAGTGKTATSIAIARELYGEDWEKCFMEINASDERGIDTIRQKVKQYARTKIIGHQFKILLLDESDSITPQGQQALRRIMERNASKCRFILSCNYPNKIIDPIIDRCVVFRFRKIKAKDMKFMLQDIVEKEDINMSKSVCYTLATLSNGSMRRALNVLHAIKKSSIKKVTDDTIYNLMCYVDDRHIQLLLKNAKEGNIKKVDDYMDRLLNLHVYSPQEIIDALRRLLVDSEVLKRKGKLKALFGLGDVEYRISIGARPDIQLKTYMVKLIYMYEKFGG